MHGVHGVRACGCARAAARVRLLACGCCAMRHAVRHAPCCMHPAACSLHLQPAHGGAEERSPRAADCGHPCSWPQPQDASSRRPTPDPRPPTPHCGAPDASIAHPPVLRGRQRRNAQLQVARGEAGRRPLLRGYRIEECVWCLLTVPLRIGGRCSLTSDVRADKIPRGDSPGHQRGFARAALPLSLDLCQNGCLSPNSTTRHWAGAAPARCTPFPRSDRPGHTLLQCPPPLELPVPAPRPARRRRWPF